MKSNDPNRFGRVKDAGEFVFAAVLTIYGILGYYLVGDQLEVTQQQTKLMRDQLADARQASAEATKSLETQLRLAASQAESLQSLAAANAKQVSITESQASFLRRQLAIAESDAASLRSQADSLNSQAESLRREVEAVSSQADSMRVVADANRQMASAASASAEAAVRIATTNVQQLEVTDRPWVRISISPAGNLQFFASAEDDTVVTPDSMKKFSDGSDGRGFFVGVPVQFALSNDGRSVANNVQVASKLVFLSPKASIGSDPLDAQATGTCNSDEKLWLGRKELFPSDVQMIHDSQFEEIPLDAIAPPSWSGLGTSVEVVLVGCATYTFGNSPTTHRTWFAYRIGRRTSREREPFETWSLEIAENVLQRNLRIEKWSFGGNGAD